MNNDILRVYKDKLVLKSYSLRTQTIYMHYMKQFVQDFLEKDLDRLTSDDINSYLLEMIKKQNISS